MIVTCKYGGDLVSLEEVLDPEPAPDGEHGDLDVEGVVAGGELVQVDGEDVAPALHHLVHQHLGSLVPVPGKVPAPGKGRGTLFIFQILDVCLRLPEVDPELEVGDGAAVVSVGEGDDGEVGVVELGRAALLPLLVIHVLPELERVDLYPGTLHLWSNIFYSVKIFLLLTCMLGTRTVDPSPRVKIISSRDLSKGSAQAACMNTVLITNLGPNIFRIIQIFLQLLNLSRTCRHPPPR